MSVDWAWNMSRVESFDIMKIEKQKYSRGPFRFQPAHNRQFSVHLHSRMFIMIVNVYQSENDPSTSTLAQCREGFFRSGIIFHLRCSLLRLDNYTHWDGKLLLLNASHLITLFPQPSPSRLLLFLIQRELGSIFNLLRPIIMFHGVIIFS